MSLEAALSQDVQQTLRLELKAWENAFAAGNGGRKAGREDIKSAPEIAAKYKAYDKLRSKSLSQNPFEPQQTSLFTPPTKKRKVINAAKSQSRNQALHAVKQDSQKKALSNHPSTLDPYDFPSIHQTPSSVRTGNVIGPTPQKNGQVLGLFDLLSPPSTKKNRIDDTPSKNLALQATANGATVLPSLPIHLPSDPRLPFTTPSKPRPPTSTRISTAAELCMTPILQRHTRTPQSSGKRKFLDAFLTPSTRRATTLASAHNESNDATPSSRRKQPSILTQYVMEATSQQPATALIDAVPTGDETPAFLRRFAAPLPSASRRPTLTKSHAATGPAITDALLGTEIPAGLEHEELAHSPVRVRLPRQMPLGRSLSEMVKNLRRAEEEKLDEEMEIMREMEMEEQGVEDGSRGVGGERKGPRWEVGDSQVVMGASIGGGGDATGVVDGEREMRLGADGEWNSSDEEGAEGKGDVAEDSRPRKVWKKNGQKRTTRRVNMKPRTAKWAPEKEWDAEEQDEEGEKNWDGDVVAETQAADPTFGHDDAGAADDVGGDHSRGAELRWDEDGDREQLEKEQRNGRGRGRPPQEKKAAENPQAREEMEGLKEKKPRKISASAHANFRALKIRNKNSRAKRGGGRFGRRR